MSKLVEARTLRPRDLFAMANGSIYTTAGHVAATGTPQARLWCTHPPDVVTFEPPLVEFPPEQLVRLLEGKETREHYHHEGYVEAAFAREMDRRHQAAMGPAHERRQRAADEQHRHTRALRPWWKKLLG